MINLNLSWCLSQVEVLLSNLFEVHYSEGSVLLLCFILTLSCFLSLCLVLWPELLFNHLFVKSLFIQVFLSLPLFYLLIGFYIVSMIAILFWVAYCLSDNLSCARFSGICFFVSTCLSLQRELNIAIVFFSLR